MTYTDPGVRHPGHPDQSLHGNWAKGLAKKAMGDKSIEDMEFEAAKAEEAANRYRIKKAKQYGSDNPDDWSDEAATWYAGMQAKADKLWSAHNAKKNAKGKKPRSFDDGELHYHRGYTDPTDRGGSPGDPIRFTASTPGVKRDGLDLRASGWRVDDFRKSPVFLWAHNKTSLPLGIVDASVGERLTASVVFDQEDDFARKVESKYRRGFLRAVSVGWDFVDGQGVRLNAGRLSHGEIRDRAFYNLTELSGVPVPADPDALIESTRAGLRSLGRELVDLFDEQEDGEAFADEVRAALYDELERMGLDPDLIREYAAQQPADQAGFFVPANPAPAVPGIDQNAARSFLAAFSLEGVK